MPKGVPNDSFQYLKGYLDAKIESFAVATEQSVRVLSQRMGELLYPMGQRVQDRMPELRSSTSEGVEVQRGTMEVGRSTPHSGTPHFQPESSERDTGDKQSKKRRVISPAMRQHISEKRKAWWASLTPAQRKAHAKKIQDVKQGKKRGRPKGSKNKPKEVENESSATT